MRQKPLLSLHGKGFAYFSFVTNKMDSHEIRMGKGEISLGISGTDSAVHRRNWPRGISMLGFFSCLPQNNMIGWLNVEINQTSKFWGL